MSTNRTTPVDFVARETLACREAGVRFPNARDDFVLLAPEPFKLGLLFDETREEVADERRDRTVLLRRAHPRPMIQLLGYRDSDVFHIYTVLQFHSRVNPVGGDCLEATTRLARG